MVVLGEPRGWGDRTESVGGGGPVSDGGKGGFEGQLDRWFFAL
jgi:hypothetical protein